MREHPRVRGVVWLDLATRQSRLRSTETLPRGLVSIVGTTTSMGFPATLRGSMDAWGYPGRQVAGPRIESHDRGAFAPHDGEPLAVLDGVWVASLRALREMMEPDQLKQMMRGFPRFFNDVDYGSRPVGDLVASGTCPC